MPDANSPRRSASHADAGTTIVARIVNAVLPIATLFVATTLVCVLTAQGQTDIRPRHFTVEDGLPEESAFAILQDRLGFLWFGTQNGLVRYDGYRMKLYGFDSTGVSGILGSSVSALAEDRGGDLWVGTNAGISRLDLQRDRFVSYRHSASDSTSISAGAVVGLFEQDDGFVWVTTGLGGIDRLDPQTGRASRLRQRLFGNDNFVLVDNWPPLAWVQAQDGRIWIGADGAGASVYNPADGRIARYRNDPTDDASISSDRVRSIYHDRDAAIWIGTRDGGLNRFVETSQSFQRYRHDSRNSASMASDDVGIISEGIDGSLWIGSIGAGLTRKPPSTIAFERYEIEGSPLVARDQSSRVVVGQDSTMWAFSSSAEVYRFDSETNRWRHMRQDTSDPKMFVGEWIRAVLPDETGGIWIGTHSAGIHRLDPFGDRFTSVHHNPSDPSSLSSSVVRSIALTPDGYVWVGTEGGGLNRFDEGTQTAKAFRADPRGRDPQRISHDEVRSLLVDNDGRLWAGTSGGLNLMADTRGDSFRRYVHDPSDPRSISGDRVNALALGRDGRIWAGTSRNGLNALDPATGTFERFHEDGPDGQRIAQNWVYALTGTPDGRIWVGTQGGLSMFDPTTATFKSYLTDLEDAITSVYEDSRGRVWIGTYSAGVWLLDRTSGAAPAVFDESNGLPNNRVLAILGDEEDNLWVSTQRGLSWFDTETGRVRNYDKSAGLPSSIFQPRAAYKARDGRLFFGGNNGFTSFKPSEIVDDPFAPRVALTEFRLAGVSVPVARNSVLTSDISRTNEITLAARQNDFGFAFAALHFSHPERNRFEYKMEGYEEEWRPADASRTASYMNLSPGTYTFRVRAANPDGVWNEEGASLAINVRPPWWRAWWAYSLYALVVGVTVLAADRFQRARLIKRERQRAQLREVELRAQAAESSARALEAENARRGIELQKAQELAVAYEKLKATQDQLIQAEKLASLGELAAGIAHEIKNPLNFVNNFAEVVEDLSQEVSENLESHYDAMSSEDAETIRDTLKELAISAGLISEHGKRADSIVRNMLDHSRDTASERVESDISALLNEYTDIVYHSELAQNETFACEIARNFDTSLPKLVVAQQELGRVFVNLLTNAFYATEERKRQSDGGYAPRVELSTQLEDGCICVSVRDNGSGMPDAVRDRIFEPFFTTKPTGTGTGLGLSLSYDIVRHSYGGDMTVESEVGSHTKFTIRLPVDGAAEPA